jgi:hypothetical protein
MFYQTVRSYLILLGWTLGSLIIKGYTQTTNTSCLPDGIEFSRQGQIDSFPLHYAACTKIDGNVKISGTTISSLLALNNIDSISGDLSITFNLSLVDLNGLDSLDFVGGNSLITANGLSSLHGLQKLSYINGKLGIAANHRLENMEGSNSLFHVDGDLSIAANSSLLSLKGLDSLTSIAGGLYLSWPLPVLPFYGNPLLTSLEGLSQLDSIGGILSIFDNDALTSLSGLDGIAPSTIDTLVITNNAKLESCAVTSICEFLVNPIGTVIIEDNALGCNTKKEVEQTCQSENTEEDIKNDLSIYPNPTTGLIILKSPEEIEHVETYLPSGFGIMISSEREIDLSDYPNGLYFLKVITPKGTYVKQIVKTR